MFEWRLFTVCKHKCHSSTYARNLDPSQRSRLLKSGGAQAVDDEARHARVLVPPPPSPRRQFPGVRLCRFPQRIQHVDKRPLSLSLPFASSALTERTAQRDGVAVVVAPRHAEQRHTSGNRYARRRVLPPSNLSTIVLKLSNSTTTTCIIHAVAQRQSARTGVVVVVRVMPRIR